MEGIPRIIVDFPELEAQIAQTVRSYTDLGDAIQTLASVSSRGSEDVARDAKMAARSMVLPQGDVNLSHMSRSLQVYGRQGLQLEATLQRLDGIQLGGVLEGVSRGPGNAPTVRPMLQQPPDPGVPQREAGIALGSAENAVRTVEKQIERHNVRNKKLVEFIDNEAKSVKSEIRSIVSNIPGNLATGFVGGLIGAMVLGYTERDRRRKEMGEMANLFEGGVDSILSSSGRRATRWFSRWGERAQWHWGVGRKETQGAVKLMVDAGFKVSEMMGKYKDGLGHVGKNVVTLALGIGKHYNFSTAEAMGDMTGLVREYGMELKDAAGFYEKLTAAGARSAIGVRTFTRTVMSASDPLSRMGVNAENAAVFVRKVIKFYTDTGLEERYAGRQAEGIVADLMNSFTQLDERLKIVLAREVYDDDESGAISLTVKFDDGLRRVSEGDSDQFLENLIRSFVRVAKERTAPGRSQGIMAVKGLLNVNNRTAQLVWDAGDELAKGGKLEDLAEDERKNLRKAFQTESQRVSSLHKTRREIIRGIGLMGESILALMADLLSLLMVGMKGLVIMARAPSNRLIEASQMVYDHQSQIYKKMGKDWESILRGADVVGGALGREFRSTFEPVLRIFRGDQRKPLPPGAATMEPPRGAKPPTYGAKWMGRGWVDPNGRLYTPTGDLTGDTIPAVAALNKLSEDEADADNLLNRIAVEGVGALGGAATGGAITVGQILGIDVTEMGEADLEQLMTPEHLSDIRRQEAKRFSEERLTNVRRAISARSAEGKRLRAFSLTGLSPNLHQMGNEAGASGEEGEPDVKTGKPKTSTKAAADAMDKSGFEASKASSLRMSQ